MKEHDLNPMEIMKGVSSEGARTYLDHKTEIMENPNLQALTQQQKLLIGIGVAAALQSSMCTLMWTKLARKAGLADDEIVEAILVSRLMKAATVNDTAAEALEWLSDTPRESSAG